MIVASFLVKDLHLDWWRGARHFLQHLVDGDLASNNHGWQWVAGTGTDASPYYRVFNPITPGQAVRPGRRLRPALGARAARRRRTGTSTSRGCARRRPRTATRSRSSTTRTSGRSPWPATSRCGPVPEGHTLFRLAREQSALFAGRPGARQQPAGPLRRGRRPARRPGAGGGLLLRQAPVRPLRRRHPARPPGAVRHVHRRHRHPARAARRPADALGGRRPGRRRRVDRPARRRPPARCWPRPEVDGDPRPARARPAAARRPTAAARTGASPRSRTAIGALLMDQSVLAGVGNVYRAEIAVPARRLPVPARPRRRRRRCGRGMWADLVALMRAGVRLGRIVTTRPEDRSRRRGAVSRRGRPLRLPAHRPAVPGAAAPRCAPRSWWAATSTGARSARPPDAGQPAVGTRPLRRGSPRPIARVRSRPMMQRPAFARSSSPSRSSAALLGCARDGVGRAHPGRLRRLLPAVRRRRCRRTARSRRRRQRRPVDQARTRASPRSSRWARGPPARSPRSRGRSCT